MIMAVLNAFHERASGTSPDQVAYVVTKLRSVYQELKPGYGALFAPYCFGRPVYFANALRDSALSQVSVISPG